MHIKSPTDFISKAFSFVIAAGFEPATDSLEGCCSIQLSYATLMAVQKYK